MDAAAQGVEVTSAIPVPLQTSDFFPHLAKLDRSSAAMLAVFVASDIIGLLKQRRELGISVPVMGVTGVTAAVPPDVLRDAAGTFVPERACRATSRTRTRPPSARSARRSAWTTTARRSAATATSRIPTTGPRGRTSTWSSAASRRPSEFPQGPKEIRPQDHQAFLEFYLSRINDKGGVDVVRKIDRKASVYPVNPPGTDYTKEHV
ncbi:MAG TPA: hypothetical protein VGU22_08510 [Methylomirabilota bacterium]|nr:hypothetical protein [Methylomirabilota bacterium]